MKIFSKLIIAFIVFTSFRVVSQTNDYDDFIGSFYAYSSNKNTKEPIVHILKKNDQFYYKTNKSSDSIFHKIDKIYLNELKDNFHKSMPKQTLILSDNHDFYIYCTISKVEGNQLYFKSTFFIATIIGSIRVFKYD